LNEEFFQITGIDSPTKIAQTRAWLKDHGLDLESLDAEAVENALELENLSSDNRRVLEIRQSLSKSSTAKYEKMLGCVNSDNRARGMLLYCGAAMTGRWSSKLIQLQNLPRGLIKSEVALFNLKTGDANINDVMESASSSIRPMMWSKDDNLVCADQAQIEARVIAWLAGDEQLLSDFAAGKKIYEMTASRLYAIRIEDVTKDQRQVGKAASLACGFQGGVAAFHRFGKQSGLKVTDEEAERNVKLWRESNPMIVKLWRELEACAKKAIKNPGTITGYGKIKYGFKNGSLLCKLPSGRILHYHKAHMENKYIEKLDCEREVIVAMVFDEDSNAYVSRALYGGLLAQRATQATARDVIAENMLAATEAGFKIVLTVHDEIVTEGGDLETLLSILRKSPDWASGLPLDAAGWIGKRYKKD
jgi:DNA polymerase